MKVIINLDILWDLLQKRNTFTNDTFKVLALMEQKSIKGFISISEPLFVTYVLRTKLSNNDVEKIRRILLHYFDFAIIDDETYKILESQPIVEDFSVACTAAQAQQIGANFIITNKVKRFKGVKTPAVTPQEFLNIIGCKAILKQEQ